MRTIKAKKMFSLFLIVACLLSATVGFSACDDSPHWTCCGLFEFPLVAGDFIEEDVIDVIPVIDKFLAATGYEKALASHDGENRVKIKFEKNSELTAFTDKTLDGFYKYELNLRKDNNTYETVLTVKDIKSAWSDYSNGSQCVCISLNSEGTAKFADATGSNVGETISLDCIENDVKTTVITAVIRDHIYSGTIVYEDYFTEEAVSELAERILFSKIAHSLSFIESYPID